MFLVRRGFGGDGEDDGFELIGMGDDRVVIGEGGAFGDGHTDDLFCVVLLAREGKWRVDVERTDVFPFDLGFRDCGSFAFCWGYYC